MRIAAVAIALLVLATSIVASIVQPALFDRLTDFFPWGDKLGHLLIMGSLSFVVVLGFASRRQPLRAAGLCVVVLLLAVTVDEVLQIWIPSRSFDLADLACNYAGILLFGAAAAALVRWRAKR